MTLKYAETRFLAWKPCQPPGQDLGPIYHFFKKLPKKILFLKIFAFFAVFDQNSPHHHPYSFPAKKIDFGRINTNHQKLPLKFPRKIHSWACIFPRASSFKTRFSTWRAYRGHSRHNKWLIHWYLSTIQLYLKLIHNLFRIYDFVLKWR